jgi:rubrerythrin
MSGVRFKTIKEVQLMGSLQETAFETAIAIETRSLSFYRAVTSRVKDNSTRRIFELLAQEEARHLDLFCTLYQGDESELVKILGKNYIDIFNDPYYCSLLNSVDAGASEKDALQIALKEEQACVDCYSAFVESLREPHIHAVFARILDETHKHCEMISEEYMRLMNTATSPDRNINVRE